MVRPQNLVVGEAGGGGQLAGRLSGRLLDVMISGSLTRLYIRARDAACATRRRASDLQRRGALRDRQLLSLDGTRPSRRLSRREGI